MNERDFEVTNSTDFSEISLAIKLISILGLAINMHHSYNFYDKERELIPALIFFLSIVAIVVLSASSISDSYFTNEDE